MGNRQPISYLQTDPRWKNEPYYSTGAYNTIGKSGCGPTCAAMIIAALHNKNVTPVSTCNYAVNHGHRSKNQGTYYSYFVPQFAEFGIACEMLSWVNTYGKPNHENHAKAIDLLKQGYWLIAVMGPGNWTTGGHFVLVWDADEANNKIYINDPASTARNCTEGSLQAFKSQVKYYWVIDAREYNAEEDDEDMTLDRFKELWIEMRKELQDNDSAKWSQAARDWAKETGLVQGGDSTDFNGMWEDVLTREALVTVLYRFAQLMGMV